MSTPPQTIYMQWRNDKLGATWTEVPVFDGDVAYVRVDAVDKEAEDLLNKQLATLDALEHLRDVVQAQLAERDARIAELEVALRECADDLEAEVRDRYAPLHPAMEHRYRRDMEPVRKVRALLSVVDATSK